MNIETKTINDLRTLSTTPAPGTFYYITDPGKEGEWYYDGTDIITKDNRGTVVTSPSNPSSGVSRMIFRRVYDSGFVNAPWFFESSDHDATIGIQKALDFISDTSYANVGAVNLGGGTVFLPKGVYYISAPLKIGQHCRLLGVVKSATYYNDNDAGSVILVALPNEASKDIWAIESATYDNSGNIINFNSFCDDANTNTHTHGIIIEQISIYANGIYGALRLTNSPYSVIRNVSIYDGKIGIYLNNCWNCAIEDSYVRRVEWYGIVLAETNVCSIKDTAVSGKLENNNEGNYFINFNVGQKPKFIPSFTNSGLDIKVELGRTGIYICKNGNANEINNCSSEVFTNGIVSLENCNTNINTAYIEKIAYYGIVTGIGESLAVMNTIYFEGIHALLGVISNSYPFYFGSGSSITISAANCMRSTPTFVGDLFKLEVDDVYITFSNTKYITRKYNKRVFFLDETPDGANYGSVYVDPTDGHDDNYGFNKNDAVQTFDAALIRVQNQSTINPVKTIYIKAAPLIHEGSPALFAAIKNLDIVPIQNADILITTYDTDNQHIRGRIFFDGDPSGEQIAVIGQIELLGNVNLYFRNVDLITNDAQLMSANPVNLSMFGLTNSYSKVIFETGDKSLLPPPFQRVNIYVNFCYFLFQANNSLINTTRNDSLLDVKFINIVLSSNSTFFVSALTLSPDTPFAPAILGVDCIQISSVLPIPNYSLSNRGWNNSIIIRNNF